MTVGTSLFGFFCELLLALLCGDLVAQGPQLIVCFLVDLVVFFAVFGKCHAQLVFMRHQARIAVDRRFSANALLADAYKNVDHTVVVVALWRVYIRVQLQQKR